MFNLDKVEYWGHATGRETALKILKNGLYIDKSRHIGATCECLKLGLKESLECIDKKELHRNYRDCVIVVIPVEYKICAKIEISYLPFCDMASINENDGILRLKIRPEFILGVYNKDTKELTKNPNFYDSLSVEEKQKCETRLKHNFCRALNSEDFGGIKRYYDNLEASDLDDWKANFPLTKEDIEKYDESKLYVKRQIKNLSSYGLPYERIEKEKNT